MSQFLVARDAFNGLVMWKQPLGIQEKPAALAWRTNIPWRSTAPVAAGKEDVFAVRKQKLTAFDGANGEEKFACENEFAPWAVRLINGTAVTAGRNASADGDKEGIEAFDATTGKRKWSVSESAFDLQASNTAVFALLKKGKNDDSVLGCDLASGKELFRVTIQDLGGGELRDRGPVGEGREGSVENRLDAVVLGPGH